MKLAYGLLAALSLSVNAEYLYPVQPGIATVQQEPVMGGVASVATVPLIDRSIDPRFNQEYSWDSRYMTVFKYIEIEKMPCVVATYGVGERSIALTCDWSKWQGESFEEKLRK